MDDRFYIRRTAINARFIKRVLSILIRNKRNSYTAFVEIMYLFAEFEPVAATAKMYFEWGRKAVSTHSKVEGNEITEVWRMK